MPAHELKLCFEVWGSLLLWWSHASQTTAPGRCMACLTKEGLRSWHMGISFCLWQSQYRHVRPSATLTPQQGDSAVPAIAAPTEPHHVVHQQLALPPTAAQHALGGATQPVEHLGGDHWCAGRRCWVRLDDGHACVLFKGAQLCTCLCVQKCTAAAARVGCCVAHHSAPHGALGKQV